MVRYLYRGRDCRSLWWKIYTYGSKIFKRHENKNCIFVLTKDFSHTILCFFIVEISLLKILRFHGFVIQNVLDSGVIFDVLSMSNGLLHAAIKQRLKEMFIYKYRSGLSVEIHVIPLKVTFIYS